MSDIFPEGILLKRNLVETGLYRIFNVDEPRQFPLFKTGIWRTRRFVMDPRTVGPVSGSPKWLNASSTVDRETMVWKVLPML